MGNGKRLDMLRLQEIYTRLVEPWNDTDDLTGETKLWYALRPDAYPIYRRRVNANMQVHGLWWMNESQWIKHLKHDDTATVLKDGQDPERVLATRIFRSGTFCYIREVDDQIDIEGISRVGMTVGGKKLRNNEWLTVSITIEAYKSLDSFLGPVDDGCKHSTEGCFA